MFHLRVASGIFHQPTLADVLGLQLELGLDEHQQLPTGGQQRCQCRQHQRERDEGQIAHDQLKPHPEALRCGPGLQQPFAAEFARVELFQRLHAGVLRHARVQLALAHIHTQHAGGTVLQQHVGKAASALAHVQAAPATGVDTAGAQRTFELEATARDVARLGGIHQFQLGGHGQIVAVFGHGLPRCRATQPPAHASGNQALRLRA